MRRLVFLFSLALASGWLVFFVAGKALSNRVAARLAGPLERLGRGKFTDSAGFVYHRWQDGLLLVTTAVAAALGVVLLDRALRRWAWYARSAGVGLGLLAFVALNLWLSVAANTALFWLPFYDPVHIENYVQYQIKKNLLREHQPPRSIVLIGNSQTAHSIDESILNEELAPHAWTTELHQPGSNGFDTLLLARDLREVQVDYTITYISEIYVYGAENGVAPPLFLRFRDLPYLRENNVWSQFPPGNIRAGLVGQVLPLFRLGHPIAHRLLGGTLTELPQQRFDAARGANPPDDAAARLRKIEVANFEKRGFETAVAELASRGAKALVIAGGTRPDLRAQVDPAVLADVAAWLASLPARWPKSCVIIPETDFFQAKTEDYEDAVHLTKEAQARFSLALAKYLKTNSLIGN